jgi:hypothetical protein
MTWLTLEQAKQHGIDLTLGDAPVTEPKPLKPVSLTPTAFDGRWFATVGPQGACRFNSVLVLDVAGSTIIGNATNPYGVFPVSGTLNLSGTGVFKIGTFGGTIRFSGTTFEANYTSQCGGRVAIGAKRAA